MSVEFLKEIEIEMRETASGRATAHLIISQEGLLAVLEDYGHLDPQQLLVEIVRLAREAGHSLPAGLGVWESQLGGTIVSGAAAENNEPWSECDNCDWNGPDKKLITPIPDLEQRIEPGGEVPSGECPGCGALCYPCQAPDRVVLDRSRGRDNEALVNFLELATDRVVTPEQAAALDEEEYWQAYTYAAAEHLAASDNYVQREEIPAWLAECPYCTHEWSHNVPSAPGDGATRGEA